MVENFPQFASAVNKRFTEISRDELFVVDGLDLWTSYLLAFPDGTDPMFRSRTVHDCSCCKNFVRNLGGVVSIAGGRKQSIWACEGLPEPYATVAAAMDQLVHQLPIKGVFRTREAKYGNTYTHDQDGRRWNHFHGLVAQRHQSQDLGTVRGELDSTAQVLRRGLTEITLPALDTVLELIESNALYRGADFQHMVQDFRRMAQEFAGMRASPATVTDPGLLIWANLHSPAARLRNTAIGTLVQDLSEGMEVERAVRAYETKVAPANYKRPTAIITPRMVDDALKTLTTLGLEGAVERRFAAISDISVRDVRWVDGGVKHRMQGGLRELLMESARPSARPACDRAVDIAVADLVSQVLPRARSLDLLVENRHEGNFASITAPVHANTGRLFKWNNDFAWSYVGEVADSIKQRVKRAGGNINAALRVSLAWHNHDDLDIHAHCPDGHVYYFNRMGILDVDMNAGVATTREPVENLAWRKPRDGNYRIIVHQFNRRETTNVGFSLEVECDGKVSYFNHREAVSPRRGVRCLSFRMRKGRMEDLQIQDATVTGGDISRELWGVKTQDWTRVNTVMTSPNHWENAGAVGSQHWFFMLEGCRNPDPARGIYNEFLRGDLDRHRRVFEVLGSRTRCQPTADQLSGVGFTAARNDTVMMRVTPDDGNSQLYNIKF